MKAIVYLCILMLPLAAKSQKKDSLQIVEEFMKVCNAYKSIPMHLDVEYVNKSDDLEKGIDSSRTQAEFYVLPEGSYMRFGEIEQFVDDSTALLVNDRLKRMIVYTNAKAIVSRMRKSMGIQFADSTIINFSKKYRAEMLSTQNDSGSIFLQTRQLLYGTLLPKETITACYDSKTLAPIKLIMVRRSLVSVNILDSSQRTEKYKDSARLITVEGGSFLVKEETSEFLYKKIEHHFTVPLTWIKDRIVKNSEGEYMPVKGYEDYIVTRNF